MCIFLYFKRLHKILKQLAENETNKKYEILRNKITFRIQGRFQRGSLIFAARGNCGSVRLCSMFGRTAANRNVLARAPIHPLHWFHIYTNIQSYTKAEEPSGFFHQHEVFGQVFRSCRCSSKPPRSVYYSPRQWKE